MVPKPRIRLEYLDSLRGLAALYVVVYHLSVQSLGMVGHLWATPLRFGHLPVSVFIVLSGYCLMLPLTKPGARIEPKTFFLRRLKRIVPAYYATLVFSLALILLVPGFGTAQGRDWDTALPAVTAPVLLSHLLLVHNLNPHWIFKLNPPLWSIATEWQIYFVFVGVLLPLWRRLGILTTVGVAFVLGLLLNKLTTEAACFPFIGLFALGMAAALVNFSDEGSVYRRWERLPWGGIALGLSVVFLVLARGNPAWMWQHISLTDVIAGPTAAALLIALTCQRRTTEKPHWLEARPLVALGRFSYSLYLVHMPVLAVFHHTLGLAHLTLSATTVFLLELGGALPLCLGVAYGSYRAFELPYLRARG